MNLFVPHGISGDDINVLFGKERIIFISISVI